MTETLQMLLASPADAPVRAADLATAIDACLTCVQACTACADSDLIEEDVVLTVSGEHQEDRSDSGDGRYVRRERRFGAFSWSIACPPGSMPRRSRRRRVTAWLR